MVSVGVSMMFNGVFGCLDDVRCCLWVSEWYMLVSVDVLIVSDGVCWCHNDV